VANKKVDADLVGELSHLLEENNLTELEWTKGDQTIRVVRNKGAPSAPLSTELPAEAARAAGEQKSPDPESEDNFNDHPGAVASPMVGTVYIAPEPSAKPFVVVGAKVAQGETLLIVEAMKTMNPIPAPKAGVISKILITDATPVEFGQVLLIIE